MFSISEKLMHSTVRIEVLNERQIPVSTGTGFFFLYKTSEVEHVIVLVTNKHVIENALLGRIVFTEAVNNKPIYGKKHSYILEDFENSFWLHPDPQIDLCAVPIQQIIDDAKNRLNKEFYIKPLDESLTPSNDDLKNLSTLEDIVMVGYPNGLWDESNNLPIIRKGITAIHPKFNYNNREDIVIDAACFPGSSVRI